MTQKWQIILLSAVVSYGSGLNAMETGKKGEPKNPLSRSIGEKSDAIIIKAAIQQKLTCSQEFIKEQEKKARQNMYYESPCGSGSSSSPETLSFYDNKVSMNILVAPYIPYFPGR